MALIRCKECGAQVSSLAQNCPSCGCPVAYSLGAQPEWNMTPPPAPESVQQSAQEVTQQPLQMPDPYTAPQPVTCSSPEQADSGKKPGKNKRIALICGICLGAVALLVGAFFLIRGLMDSSSPGVYYPPGYNNYQGNQGTAASTEPTFTTGVVVSPLEGDWTNSLMETISFESLGGELKQRHKRYDYLNSTWVETTYTVREVTNDTVSLVDIYGNIKTAIYALSEDGTQLTMDGFYYHRQEDASNTILNQYLVSGVPAFGNAYFGMSKQEVKACAETVYNRTDDKTLNDYYDAPKLMEGQHSSFLVYDFADAQGDLKGARLFSNKATNLPADYEKMQRQIIAFCDARYGKNRKSESYDYVTYKWSCGKIEIRLSVYETFLAWCFEMKD